MGDAFSGWKLLGKVSPRPPSKVFNDLTDFCLCRSGCDAVQEQHKCSFRTVYLSGFALLTNCIVSVLRTGGCQVVVRSSSPKPQLHECALLFKGGGTPSANSPTALSQQGVTGDSALHPTTNLSTYFLLLTCFYHANTVSTLETTFFGSFTSPASVSITT